MRRRLLKYLRRLLIVVLVLGAIGVGVFTWLCFWPLEGSVDDVLLLVPEEVEFVLRTGYDDLEGTGWVQENALDNPLHPILADNAKEALETAREQIAEIERQINANIPLDIARYDVEDDALRGEVVIAGNFCRGVGPDRGPPRWQEILVLTRVAWKTRCVAALKHGFIRDQLGPNLQVDAEDEEVYRLTFPNVQVTPESMRSVCGGGFVMPPENQWFLRRVKDVVAISNSETLIHRVADLARTGGPQGSFAARPGFNVARQPGRIVAAVNIEPLHWYFTRAFEYYPELRPLRRFLQPTALEKLNGHLSFEGTDLLAGGADISYIPAQAQAVVQSVYSLGERSMREGIATFVPAEDTFAVLSLRCDPQYLLKSLVADVLEPADRQLWEDNLRRMKEFESLDEFFEDLSTRIGNQAMVALGRLSDTFDTIHHTEFFTGEVDPMPAVAIMVRIKEGADQAELDAYMASKVPLLGFSKELKKIEYRGFAYSRAELEQKILDYALVTPCFILAQDHLIITLNEPYMRQILDTVQERDVGALAEDPTFLQTMAALPQRGHVGFFLDLEKLTRVPRSAAGGGPPGSRGFLWDQRNQWVITNRDPRSEAIKFRAEERKKYPARMTGQQQLALEDAVDRHVEHWYTLYPQFEEERRRELEKLRRFRGAGLVLGATADTIGAHFALVFRDAESWVHWRR